MARNRNKRTSGGRGRNRGNGGYARPIVEPSNFVEMDLIVQANVRSGVSSAASISFDNILTRLANYVPLASIERFRISSFVVDPINVSTAYGTAGDSTDTSLTNITAMAVQHVPFELSTYNGIHYSQSDIDKPLRVRCSNEYNGLGMWIRTNGGALLPTGSIPVPGDTPGNTTALLLSPELVGPSVVDTNDLILLRSYQAEIHFRIAWDDSVDI